MNGINAIKGVARGINALRDTLAEPDVRAQLPNLERAHRPRPKPIHRAHMLPYVAVVQASALLGTNAAALVAVGQMAALTRSRKSALANDAGRDDGVVTTDHGEHEHAGELLEATHDSPSRLSELREQLSRLPAEDLARYAGLAGNAGGRGYGFAIEPVSVESLPKSLGQTQLRLSSADVMPSLCLQGCIYAGPVVSAQVGNSRVDVIDAKSAEAIMSFEGLRSYLNLLR